MDNYNPRQNTRMRWKDARELEKFIFLTGYFHFQTEVLENVLEDELYGKLYRELQFCVDNTTSKGVLITDTYSNALFIGTIFDDSTMQLINFCNNQADIIDINIANDNELNITKEKETFLSEDNVKTLFGNQSIIGQGNIDLYRHQLECEINEDSNTFLFEIISSNNLKIDSLQDLTTVTKATNESNIKYLILDTSIWTVGYLYYQGGLWYIIEANSKLYTVASINDVVTTI